MTEKNSLGEAREQLLLRILTSRQFAHADTLKRILRFLVQRSADPQTASPKEYDIAVSAMGRPANFDPRTDPIVRVSLGSIRERLQAYFGTEGKGEPLRLEIPRGQYGVVFANAVQESASARNGGAPGHGTGALARLWQPYFTGLVANIIVYTEPLFFRDEDGHYFRDWNVNNVSTGLEELQNTFEGFDTSRFSPVFHYLSAGEMRCLLSLTRMFYELGIPIETRNSRNASWQELSRSNLILLGSPRTNQFLRSLQGGHPLIVRDLCVEETPPGETEKREYVCARFMDGQLPRMTEHAVVTRRPGVVEGTCATIIGANHGRAIEAAGHILTLENRVEELLERLEKDRAPVKNFQLLMKVQTVDIDDEVTSVECERHYVLQETPAA